jgi:hypothetical protein
MTDSEILHGFEDGSFPKEQWNHAAHLRVAGCYLLGHPVEEALRRMREGVRRYNEATGGKNSEDSGYHETLTCFWIAVAGGFLAALLGRMTAADKIQALVDEFGSRRDLFREYYGFDVVKSREARAGWVEPDLKALPVAEPRP